LPGAVSQPRPFPFHTMNHFSIVHVYSRSQAIADGVQVEVTKTAHEAGIQFPVFYVRNSNTERPRLVKLIATCGPLDIDDTQPAITVMLPDED